MINKPLIRPRIMSDAFSRNMSKCPECGKHLTEEDAYGHDCEVDEKHTVRTQEESKVRWKKFKKEHPERFGD